MDRNRERMRLQRPFDDNDQGAGYYPLVNKKDAARNPYEYPKASWEKVERQKKTRPDSPYVMINDDFDLTDWVKDKSPKKDLSKEDLQAILDESEKQQKIMDEIINQNIPIEELIKAEEKKQYSAITDAVSGLPEHKSLEPIESEISPTQYNQIYKNFGYVPMDTGFIPNTVADYRKEWFPEPPLNPKTKDMKLHEFVEHLNKEDEEFLPGITFVSERIKMFISGLFFLIIFLMFIIIVILLILRLRNELRAPDTYYPKRKK